MKKKMLMYFVKNISFVTFNCEQIELGESKLGGQDEHFAEK